MIVVDFREKLDDLVLYIARQSECDPDFGAIKMQKILFMAEFGHYARYGSPITGKKFQKWRDGPVMPAYRYAEARLTGAKKAAIQERSVGPRTQKRLVALTEPDLTRLSADEIKSVDEAIDALSGMNAGDVSRWSHEFVGWKAARPNEVIPHETVFVSKRPLTPGERARGAELAESLGR